MADSEAKIIIKAQNDASASLQKVTQDLKETQTAMEGVTTASKETTELNIVKYWEQNAQAVEKLNPAFRENVPLIQNMTKETAELAKAMKQTEGGFNLAGVASQAFGVALGVLGVQTALAATRALVDLGKETATLAIHFEGVQARAKAIFGTSFPQMTQEANKMADAMGRSRAQTLDFETGFGTILTSFGFGTTQVNAFSQELTGLTETLGKAFPDKADVDIYNALAQALEGNVRGLRQLGIVVNDKILNDYAESQGIELKVSKMDAEQKATLTTHYLLTQTAALQEAGAKSAGNLGDSVKSLSAEWQQMLTELGTDIAPAMNLFVKTVDGGLRLIDQSIKTTGDLWHGLMAMISDGISTEKGALDAGNAMNNANFALQQKFGIGTGKRTKEQQEAFNTGQAAMHPKQDWQDHSGGGGGGKSEAAKEEAEYNKLLAEEKTITSDILKTWGEMAKSNLDRLKTEHDELELKQKLGTITDDETRALDRMNRLVEFQKDNVSDTTKAWEDQQKKLDQVEKKIESINQKIIDAGVALKDSLAKIDEHTGQSEAKEVEKLIKRKKDLDDKIASGGGRTKKEQDEYSSITTQLDGAKGASYYSEGEALSKMTDLQKIQHEGDIKKQDATKQSKEKTDKLNQELIGEQANAKAIQSLEEQKKQAVINALTERHNKTRETYAKIQTDTENHISVQTKQFATLSSLVDNILAKNSQLNGSTQGPLGNIAGLRNAPVQPVTVTIQTMHVGSAADGKKIAQHLSREIQLATSNAH